MRPLGRRQWPHVLLCYTAMLPQEYAVLAQRSSFNIFEEQVCPNLPIR